MLYSNTHHLATCIPSQHVILRPIVLGSRPGVPMQPTQFNEPQRMPHDLQMTSASPRPQQQLSMQPQLRQFRMPQPVSQMPGASQRMTFRSPTKLSQGSVSRQMFVPAGSGNYGQQSMFMSQQQQSQVGSKVNTLHGYQL